jgi:hypothetical protein
MQENKYINKVVNIILKYNNYLLANHHDIKYYEMTVMSKRPLISESVAAIRINLHPLG